MTIDNTAPIHELDRLLDGTLAVYDSTPGAAWTPTLQRLSRLDDDLAPREDVLRQIRRRVLTEVGQASAETDPVNAVPAPPAPIVTAVPLARVRSRRRDERWVLAPAAAAVLLLAIGSVWLGRGVGSDPLAADPSVALNDAAPISRPVRAGAASAETEAVPEAGFSADADAWTGAPGDVTGISAADVARASVGGFGSADLVGLLALGADVGQREYQERRQEVLVEADASWTSFVEERRWRELLPAPPPDAAGRPWSSEKGAG